jgi:hypothetical protein
MTLAKFMVKKKFRQENSVSMSISSCAIVPFGRTVVRVTARRGGLGMLSSTRVSGGFFERCCKQYRKKLKYLMCCVYVKVSSVLVFRRIRFGHNRHGHILHPKHFHDEEETVRVKQQLAKMMKFHHI